MVEEDVRMGAVCVGSEERKEGVEKEERKVGWKRRKGKRRVWERWKGRTSGKGGNIGLVHEQRLDKTKV